MRGLVAIPLCLVLAVGCGGGGRLSAAQLREQADAACRKYEARFKALGTPQTLPQLKAFAEEAIPIAKAARDEFRGLEPPEELEATYDQWLGSSDEAVDALERLRKAADENDLVEVQRIGRRAAAEDRRSDALARKLGLKACATE